MSYRRGFFRLWIAFAVLWGLSVWWLALYASGANGLSCMWQGGPWCDFRMIPDLQTGLAYLLVVAGVVLA
jgi:hypothetical protein